MENEVLKRNMFSLILSTLKYRKPKVMHLCWSYLGFRALQLRPELVVLARPNADHGRCSNGAPWRRRGRVERRRRPARRRRLVGGTLGRGGGHPGLEWIEVYD